MAEYKLTAEPRENLKKGFTKALRRDGNVPGIYYFHKQDAVPFFVDKKELRKALHSSEKIYDLAIGKKSHKAIVKKVHHDPVTEEILHIDFMGVNLNEVINFKIPVVLINTDACVGVKEFGGMLEQQAWNLEIKCKVSELPENITIDVADLKLGEAILVRDLKIEGFEILSPETSPIVSVIVPSGVGAEEEEGEEDEALEGEETVESETE